MTPIEGKDALIRFYKGDDYFNYACATDLSISFDMDTKSVKTVGDGTTRKFKGQITGYSISLSGLVMLDDVTDPTAFDLIEYHRQMVDVQFEILFQDIAHSLLKIISGNALVTQAQLGAPSEGFVSGGFTLLGNGAVDIQNANINCAITITNVTRGSGTPITGGQRYPITITKTGGTPIRYDYTIDGGGRLVGYTDSFYIIVPSFGVHSVVFYPICANGFDGTSFTLTIP